MIVENGHLNGEVIRLDGALRMAPRYAPLFCEVRFKGAGKY